MTKDLVRVSLMIREDQHEALRDKDINVSGFIRDMIDDRLSKHRIVLSVSDETKTLYDQIISHTAECDQSFEPYLKEALKKMLADKIALMQKLHKSM